MNESIQLPGNTLARYLKAAARQRYLMEPWRNDKRFVAQGGTVFHAVDTDIVVLYTNPSETSVATQRRREGYAQIFPDDEKPVSIALGRTLADFVFQALGAEGRPLFVIPPLEQEIRTVFASVKRKSVEEQQHAYRELEKLRGLVTKLKTINDPDRVAEEMLHNAPKLACFLAGETGPSAEHRRFLKLLAGKRLLPLDVAVESGFFQDEMIRRAMEPVTDFGDRVALHDLREAWLDRLRKRKSSSRDLVYVFDDAQVLARLEWINGRLDKKSRMVLITGDQAMFEAASFVPEGEEASFAELYLRHPKCYLAEPWVLSPEKAEDTERAKEAETEFFNWLETFLSNLRLENDSYAAALRDLIALKESDVEALLMCGQGDRDSIMREFQSRWRGYARSVMLDHGTPPSAEYLENEAARKLWEDLRDSFARAADQLESKVQETWKDFFDLSTATGYEMLFLRQTERGERQVRARNSPPLDFDRLKEARAFIKTIMASYDAGRLENYRAEIEKLREEDATGYTYYLAFAVLFATEGVWGVSVIMADRALDIAKDCGEKRISGREASYLLAVALRHVSTNVGDLKPVSYLLDQANECLKKDKQGCSGLKVSAIRFDAERVALALTYHFFQRFQGEILPAEVLPLVSVEEKARQLLACLDREEKPDIRHIVERNLLTNLFMSVFLRLGNLVGNETDDREALRSYFEQFRVNLSENGEVIRKTFLVKSVYLVAAWWMTEEKRQKKACLREIQLFLNEDNIQANKVMPYDIPRFRFLRQLIEPPKPAPVPGQR
ncbi:MAG: hypothetical protein ACYCTY_11115 [Sulfuricella sp.]